MAIETAYFNTPGEGHFTEIKAWLDENAKEYFDSVEVSEDNASLTCYVGEIAAVKISRSSATSNYSYGFTYTLKNGAKYACATNSARQYYINRIVKTSCGLAFAVYALTDAKDQSFVNIITRTDKGGLAFLFEPGVWGSSPLYAASFENSSVFSGINIYYTTANLTTLVNIPCLGSHDYMPGAFYQFFRPDNLNGVIDVNGTKYLTTGTYCLKE